MGSTYFVRRPPRTTAVVGKTVTAFLSGAAKLITRPRFITSRRAGLFQAWPYAAVALHYLDGFLDRFRKAVAVAGDLFKVLEKDGRLRVEAVPRGTNVFKVHVKGVDAKQYRAALGRNGIRVRGPEPGQEGQVLWLVVNETLTGRSAEEVGRVFAESLSNS